MVEKIRKKKKVATPLKSTKKTKVGRSSVVLSAKRKIKKKTTSKKSTQKKSSNKASSKVKSSIKKSTKDKKVTREQQYVQVESSSLSLKRPKKNFEDREEVPMNYGDTYIKLVVRDPYCIYAYWEVAEYSLEQLKKEMGDDFYHAARTVRMYDVTYKDFNGINANHWFDIDVSPYTNSWYVHLWNDDVVYCAEIGLRAPSGRFYSMARSNFVATPREGLSYRRDEIWMEVKDNIASRPFVLGYWLRGKSANGGGRQKIYLTMDDLLAYYGKKLSLSKLLESIGYKFKLDAQNNILGFFDKDGRFVKRLLLGASEEMLLVEESQKRMVELMVEMRKTGASEHLVGGRS